MQKLGKTQRAIYEFVRAYIDENSISPTLREICAAVGLKSISSAHTHLKSLADKGLINISQDKRRAITLPRCENEYSGLRFVPVVGTVAAGSPILAFDNIVGRYALPESILHGAAEDEAFLLRVRGNSMINAGILSGDLIIVHTGLQVNDGDIAVARIGGEEATVKRIYYMRKKLRLQPENPDMEPMIYDIDEVELIGRVIGLMRGM